MVHAFCLFINIGSVFIIGKLYVELILNSIKLLVETTYTNIWINNWHLCNFLNGISTMTQSFGRICLIYLRRTDMLAEPSQSCTSRLWTQLLISNRQYKCISQFVCLFVCYTARSGSPKTNQPKTNQRSEQLLAVSCKCYL